MRTKIKTVFYCDYCNKHGLRGRAIEGHERGCTMNPHRVCRWSMDATEGHGDPDVRQEHPPFLPNLVSWLQSRAEPVLPTSKIKYLTEATIDQLRLRCEGCPACMLAALRQSGVEFHNTARGGPLFTYELEVERWRKVERELQHRADHAAGF